MRFDGDMKYYRSINLAIAALGNREEVFRLLGSAKQRFQKRVSTLPITLYSQRTLELAENDPSLLRKKNAPLRITNGNFSRTYTGFVSSRGEDLHSYLYCNRETEDGWVGYPYYSPGTLSKIIHRNFDGCESQEEEAFGDVLIKLNHTPIDKSSSYAYLTFQVREDLVRDDFRLHLDWVNSLIEELDASCPDAFHSAYLSLAHPERPIMHTGVYDVFDESLCGRYLLGAEWEMYLGKAIVNEEIRGAVESVARITPLENGLLCSVGDSVFSFDGAQRKKLTTALNRWLMPAFGVYSWEGLHNQDWRVDYLPQAIHVYHDPFARDNPTVVLSHNCDMDDVEDLKGLQRSNLLDAFFLRK